MLKGRCVDVLTTDGKELTFYNLTKLNDPRIDKLPFSIRVLLESAIRNCDGFQVHDSDIENIVDWEVKQHESVEVPFRPARVILQDLTGVPAVVDIASMREAVQRLGGDPEKINPICPSDLVIDHSVQVDFARTPAALKKNEQKEFERNRERFTFLKWGANSLKNMIIVPPGSGIVHQVNLEYLARVVFNDQGVLYPDSLVGTDSHTTMINGLGIVGWGVGGIEAEAVMLGQAISMVLPKVIGYKLVGQLSSLATSTDLVLTVVQHLRKIGVVGKFVEFFGPGLTEMTIADRATISNMCPEYGATVGFFPPDEQTLVYLKQTGRDDGDISCVEKYLKANKLFRDYSDSKQDPVFSEVYELDLSEVVSCLSGPKRPHDKVPVSDMKQDFRACLTHQVGFKGFGIRKEKLLVESKFICETDGKPYTISHGSVVIAAITSCTNTSNPSVMIAAGLLAKKAVEKGLSVLPYIKTSLAPGSGVVTFYLKESGVTPYLAKLGFDTVGYGCTTCIGNSGPLEDSIADAIEKSDLIVASVLSGNRNFEGRVHPLTRANYLASPPLVVAYALAGRVDIDFETEPLGYSGGPAGAPVYLRDIWPDRKEVAEVESKNVLPSMFTSVYADICKGSDDWQALDAPNLTLFPWDPQSTYVKNPPYFDSMSRELPAIQSIVDAHVLVNFGDSVTTDHISPAGAIAKTSPAARFLIERGIERRDFNTYGSRRGHDGVMARGTFANIRLLNKFLGRQSPRTIHIPSGEEMDIFDAAQKYIESGTPLIVLCGKEYGQGSSRDWAAKGPWMQGVKAVLAESFERIHRSNLIGMGLVPLQYQEGDSAESLGLTGREKYSIEIPSDIKTQQRVKVKVDSGKEFDVIARFDTEVELTYFRHGGILNYMIRKML